MEARRPKWSNQTKLVISLMLVALFLYLIARFRTVIPPLILACILAYVLSPFVNLLHNRTRIPRILAITISYLLLIGIMVTIPIVIIPILGSQLTGLNLDIQRLLAQIESLLGNKLVVFGQNIDVAVVIERAASTLQSMLEPFVGQTLGLLVEVISSIAWIIFILVISFYLIKDSARLKSWIEDHIPPAYQKDYTQLRDEINQVWSAFFRGQLVLGLVVAILITVVGLILGLPFALAMGVLAGFLEFLPSLGHAIWVAIAAILAFFIGSTWLPVPNWVFMLIVVGLHLIFEQFDLNYLIPRIIGRRVHLPPLVVILGIVTGAVLAGVLGILLASPTIASGRILGRYVYANLFDLDPFPQASTSPLPPPNPRWWQHAHKRHSKINTN
jgi:predicted PurR-regulated permease PerM